MPRSVRHTATATTRATTPDDTDSVRTARCWCQDPILTCTLQQILRTVSDNQRLLQARIAPLMVRNRSTQHEGRLGRMSDQRVIRTPRDVWELLGDDMSILVQEQLRVLLLNTKGGVLACHMIYQGTIHSISIRAAEVLRPAVLANAPSVIVVHNHPSGDPDPSPEDIRTTKRLMAAGDTVDIQVLDHIILGSEGRYVSMQERGLVRQRTGSAAA